MKKIREMSKNEKIKYLFELLPQYYDEDSKDALYFERLRKVYFYKTQKGKPIQMQLKEINFDITEYEELDQFLFILSYIVLTHAERKIIKNQNSKAEKLPNKNVVYYIKKVDIDSDINNLVAFFWINSDTYILLKRDIVEDAKKNGIKIEENRLIEEINLHLNFQHRKYESDNKLNVYKNEIELNKNDSGERLKEMLSEAGNVYERAYFTFWSEDEKWLHNCIYNLYKINSLYRFLMNIKKLLEIDFFELMKNQKERDIEDSFLTYVLCMRFLIETYNIFIFKSLTSEEGDISVGQDLYETYKLALGHLKVFGKKIIMSRFQNDIFLHFGAHIYSIFYKNYFEYIYKVSEDSLEKFIKEEKDIISKDEKDGIIFTEQYIDEVKTKELLDYILPNKEKRKQNDRNEIKKRLKYILKLMEKLSEFNPVFYESKYGKNIKLMYLIVYGNYTSEFRIKRTTPKKLYDGKYKELKRSECIMLTEKYMYGRYAWEGKVEKYRVHLKRRNQLVRECGINLDSIVKMKDRMIVIL